MIKIGIIGKGFVGKAVKYGFSSMKDCEIKVYDKNPERSECSLNEVVNNSDYLFVSVPTPSNPDGSINLEVVDLCLNEIDKVNFSEPIVLLRSTIIPGSSKKFQNKYPNLNIVFNPEFLTERNANFDFINQSRIIIGGKKIHTKKVAVLFQTRFGAKIPIVETNFETAELIKYMNNCFLATKVSFMNEMKLLADISGANWDAAVNGFSLDERVGNSHMNVPGFDGKPGFGGSCFPKDVQALINYAKINNIDLNTLSGAWKTNLKLRPDKDWEVLVGRSVIKDD
jgi:nucleotide sugar dehydrogenase